MTRRSTLRRSATFAVAKAAALALTATLTAGLFGGVATADATKSSSVTSVTKEGRLWHLKVYSAAMDREIPIDVHRPVDESKPAPNLYMLVGLDGGEGTANWHDKTKALDWLGDKPINIIEPLAGRGSYYTDWLQADPVLGMNKWRTFFTEELPPLLDSTLGSSGVNALTGLSTSGTAVLALAEAKPGLWKSVAAYSGCAQTSDPMGQKFVKLAVETWASGDTKNMYGPTDSPLWAQNDPVVNAEKLRGTKLFIASGSGIPAAKDVETYMTEGGPVSGSINLGAGMLIEAATNTCTANLKNRLESLNIPATYQFSDGTHNWPLWERTLPASWPVLAEGMGVS
ncbi:esterase family protein [Nocardia panacis]|uniref:Esterase family protein n=1 Tax=Nocardia panacis TaxID=2340916 RepID=A0A3A4KLM8_9NOCA|nr:alpha/beta hydrolase family protein [Nocardia panacis]RJO76458.1 esterase family protein [Nocardia panacis]